MGLLVMVGKRKSRGQGLGHDGSRLERSLRVRIFTSVSLVS